MAPRRCPWSHHGAEELFNAYRAANVCVVSSLRDGMNLVTKEFSAARDDRHGVLILSPFTGAAREMPESLLVSPYATDAFADALNIFRWAGLPLDETFRLADAEPSS